MTHTEFKIRFLPLHQTLLSEARKMLCDDFEAEDAVQNLYLRLWAGRENLKNLTSPEGYCRAALRNICIDRWRALRLAEEKNHLLVEEAITETPPEADGEDIQECLSHFLSSLPDIQRRIMKMTINGYSIREIEQITGVPETNIRVTVSRLRKRFRKYINNEQNRQGLL